MSNKNSIFVKPSTSNMVIDQIFTIPNRIETSGSTGSAGSNLVINLVIIGYRDTEWIAGYSTDFGNNFEYLTIENVDRIDYVNNSKYIWSLFCKKGNDYYIKQTTFFDAVVYSTTIIFFEKVNVAISLNTPYFAGLFTDPVPGNSSLAKVLYPSYELEKVPCPLEIITCYCWNGEIVLLGGTNGLYLTNNDMINFTLCNEDINNIVEIYYNKKYFMVNGVKNGTNKIVISTDGYTWMDIEMFGYLISFTTNNYFTYMATTSIISRTLNFIEIENVSTLNFSINKLVMLYNNRLIGLADDKILIFDGQGITYYKDMPMICTNLAQNASLTNNNLSGTRSLGYKNILAVTGHYQLSQFDEILLVNAPANITLPDPRGISGKIYTIVNRTSGSINIIGTIINSQGSKNLDSYLSISYQAVNDLWQDIALLGNT